VIELVTLKEPGESFPIPESPERPEEFAPDLDPEMDELVGALAEYKEKIKSGKNGLGTKTRAKT
jgi:Mn-containing catalase